jgi:hypothetical protein
MLDGSDQYVTIHQDKIGWTNFILGRLALEQASVQQMCYDWIGRKKIGK